MEYLKFKGDFKKLKSLNFSFRKIWASNYKCYQFKDGTLDHLKVDFKIWVAKREIDLFGFGMHSLTFLNFIKDVLKQQQSSEFIVINCNFKDITFSLWNDEINTAYINDMDKYYSSNKKMVFCLNNLQDTLILLDKVENLE